MELRSEKVVERFELYANEPMDGEEAQRDHLCQTLCQECTQWVQSQVRVEEREAAGDGAGFAEPEGLTVLESYAAAEAFYQLAVLDQASLPQALSSPEVKLQLGDRVGHANRIREEKRKACGALLPENGFYFGQI